MRLVRVISCFEKATEELVKDVRLTAQQFRQIKALLVPRADDPDMIYVYRIPRKHRRAVEAICGIAMDFQTLDYFLGTFHPDRRGRKTSQRYS